MEDSVKSFAAVEVNNTYCSPHQSVPSFCTAGSSPSVFLIPSSFLKLNLKNKIYLSAVKKKEKVFTLSLNYLKVYN